MDREDWGLEMNYKWDFTWSCDISTDSLKTVQVTASLQGGVVREPLYRKYFALSAGRRESSGKDAMILFVPKKEKEWRNDWLVIWPLKGKNGSTEKN